MENKNVQSRLACYCIHGGVIHERSIKDSAQNSQIDLDRRTVKKYYDGYEGKAAHRDKSSKLDKHYDLIKQKLSIRGANVRAVYEFILSERDPNIGIFADR